MERVSVTPQATLKASSMLPSMLMAVKSRVKRPMAPTEPMLVLLI